MTPFGTIILTITALPLVTGQSWVSNARLKNGNDYYAQVMQETVTELERREWSNLKLLDIHQELNLQMYNWLVSGTVTYTNGFLVSMQAIDLTNVQSFVSSRTVDNVTTVVAGVQGMLNMRNVMIGYDVVANLTNEGVQHYTGTFDHTLLQMTCVIEKNIHLDTYATSARINSLSGGLDRMQYLPSTSLTEVISRQYVPGNIWDGVSQWGIDIIGPIMLEVASNRIPFPEICFNNC